MIDQERAHHAWLWLRGPLAGLSTSSVLAGLMSLPWAAIGTALGAFVPMAIGTYWGWRERRARFEFEQSMRRIRIEAERKKLEATPGDQIHVEDFGHDPGRGGDAK